MRTISEGGHLSTANQRTYPAMATRGCLATYGGVSAWRSVMDLFSDVLSTRPGQYVFFNIADIGGGERPEDFLEFCDPESDYSNSGYTGVFKITGTPRFDPRSLEATTGDDNAKLEEQYALRVPIEPFGVFPGVLQEWRILDTVDLQTELWQPRFRKFLNSAKSLTAMTPFEATRLMEILDENLPHWRKASDYDWTRYPDTGKMLSMTNIQGQGGDGRDLSGPSDGLDSIELSDIPVRKGRKFRHEKGLEAWWVENFDLGIDEFERLTYDTDIMWFSNYIPATSSGQELDGLALGKKPNGKYRAFPIEMKKGSVNQSNKGEVDQLYRYSVWAKMFLSEKVDTDVEDVRPTFLANEMGDTARRVAESRLHSEPYFTNPCLIKYQLTEGGDVQLEWVDI